MRGWIAVHINFPFEWESVFARLPCSIGLAAFLSFDLLSNDFVPLTKRRICPSELVGDQQQSGQGLPALARS